MAQLLFSANLAKLDLRVNVIALAFSVGVSAVLIPRWGATGAASAALASSVAYAALQYVYVTRRVTHVVLVGTLGRIGSSAGLGCSVAVLCLWLKWSPLSVACAALVVYVATLLGTGSIRRRDLAAAFAMFAHARESR
jgi:O-antigen/teichoic acid export membrane protein